MLKWRLVPLTRVCRRTYTLLNKNASPTATFCNMIVTCSINLSKWRLLPASACMLWRIWAHAYCPHNAGNCRTNSWEVAGPGSYGHFVTNKEAEQTTTKKSIEVLNKNPANSRLKSWPTINLLEREEQARFVRDTFYFDHSCYFWK